MSAAEELTDGGGSGAPEVDSTSGVNEFEDSDSFIYKSMGIDPSKYGIGENKEEDKPQGEVEEVSEGEESGDAGQATDEKSYLDWVNSLGAIHNGNPVKVDSIEEVKNALQMYKDYTPKTQALSADRKAFEEERSLAEKEFTAAIEEFNGLQKQHEQQFRELQQWTMAIEQLKKDAPDIFEEVRGVYGNVAKHFDNPVVNQQLAEIKRELAEAKKGLEDREGRAIMDEFEREKGQLSATEQSLNELGVKINWDEAKQAWANTGLPLKQVVGALYFENVAKAQASKNKVQAVKTKVAPKTTGAAALSRPGSSKPVVKNTGDYLAMAQEILKNMK